MPLAENSFADLPLPKLVEIQEAYTQCVLDIANGGQSYTMGRSFTRADLEQVRATLREVGVAIEYKSGRSVRVAQARVRSRR